jgi:hypothetical protein
VQLVFQAVVSAEASFGSLHRVASDEPRDGGLAGFRARKIAARRERRLGFQTARRWGQGRGGDLFRLIRSSYGYFGMDLIRNSLGEYLQRCQELTLMYSL